MKLFKGKKEDFEKKALKFEIERIYERNKEIEDMIDFVCLNISTFPSQEVYDKLYSASLELSINTAYLKIIKSDFLS